jgi:hypothetical protein
VSEIGIEGGRSGRRGRLSPPRRGVAGAAELDSVDPVGAAGAVVEAATEAGGLVVADGLCVEPELELELELELGVLLHCQ